MALSYSTTVSNARLDAIATSIGATAKLRIYSGSAPAIGVTATGTLLCEMILPTTWLAAAAAGTVGKSGSWTGAGLAVGTAGYFRIVPNAAGVNAVGGIQGLCAISASDMNLDNTSIAVSQVVTVTGFTITAANV